VAVVEGGKLRFLETYTAKARQMRWLVWIDL
jgi:hypothetical protein